MNSNLTNLVEVTQQNLKEILEKNEIVILDFWASWCGPCRMFGPIFEKSAANHPEIAFGKVDTEAQVELASSFQINSIPTVMVFRQNILVYERPGAMPQQALEALLSEVQKLDMEKVKKEISESKKAANQ